MINSPRSALFVMDAPIASILEYGYRCTITCINRLAGPNHVRMAIGSFLLFAVNIVAIVLSSAVALWATGLRVDRCAPHAANS
jgi:hypothetical protein